MSITRWDPFRELQDMSNRLNRVFGKSSSLERRSSEDMTFPDWQPAVDISETPESFIVKAELPDVKKEDIHVSVSDGVLSLSGERKQEKEEKNKKVHRIERTYGSFLRTFALPESVDASKIQAESKEGVLTVQLPKSPERQPKSVNIKVN